MVRFDGRPFTDPEHQVLELDIRREVGVLDALTRLIRLVVEHLAQPAATVDRQPLVVSEDLGALLVCLEHLEDRAQLVALGCSSGSTDTARVSTAASARAHATAFDRPP
jgi:hypothetical protein